MNACTDRYIAILNIFPFALLPVNRMGGVMVSVVVSCAVDRVFEPRSCQTKDYKISICYVSTKYTALRSES